MTCSMLETDTASQDHLSHSEEGFALVEVLVSILIMALLSLGVAKNLITALQTAKFTEANHAASSLAISRMEELAARNVKDLDTSFNGTETVSWPSLDFQFSRQTAVTVNANESRTITVTVTSQSAKIPTEVEFITTLASWE
ncbi:MAG: type II secretion system protein [Bdellovibrionales bacterium]|nr:type II secretion system protein [Bdellovibrionales bacterium]